MAISSSFEVLGAKELEKALKLLPAKLELKTIKALGLMGVA